MELASRMQHVLASTKLWQALCRLGAEQHTCMKWPVLPAAVRGWNSQAAKTNIVVPCSMLASSNQFWRQLEQGSCWKMVACSKPTPTMMPYLSPMWLLLRVLINNRPSLYMTNYFAARLLCQSCTFMPKSSGNDAGYNVIMILDLVVLCIGEMQAAQDKA